MYEIDIADQQECLPVDKGYITDVVRRTLAAEKVRSASISVAIVDNPTIHELNRQYLQHDYATDVLSFLLGDAGDAASEADGEFDTHDASNADDSNSLKSASGMNFEPRACGRHIDGEVIVSAEYAEELAANYDWSPLAELTLYIVHGLLHLCGYDDLTADELPIMRRRECDIFAVLGLPRPARDADDIGHVGDASAVSQQLPSGTIGADARSPQPEAGGSA